MALHFYWPLLLKVCMRNMCSLWPFLLFSLPSGHCYGPGLNPGALSTLITLMISSSFTVLNTISMLMTLTLFISSPRLFSGTPNSYSTFSVGCLISISIRQILTLSFWFFLSLTSYSLSHLSKWRFHSFGYSGKEKKKSVSFMFYIQFVRKSCCFHLKNNIQHQTTSQHCNHLLSSLTTPSRLRATCWTLPDNMRE